jgi:HSP20 family protein
MITHWDPFGDFNRFERALTRGFGLSTSRNAPFRPAVDISEDETAFRVAAELPGLMKEDVKVELEKNVLTLRGERSLKNEETKENYRRIERTYGSFERSFVLPETVDAEHIAAEMKDGVLHVTLPKRALPGPRQVEIQAA